jgi:ribosome-associated toxin RatA of RatAB toxin-antitoxin module
MARVSYRPGMAINESKEVVIEATPAEIVDVIADIESGPQWQGAQQSAEVLETNDDGRPRQVKTKVKSAGITDELVVEYHTWSDDVVSWSLVSSKQLKTQEGRYTLTPQGDKTKVRFDLTIDPSVPIPGFILKRALKGAISDATDGLRKQVLAVKKGR